MIQNQKRFRINSSRKNDAMIFQGIVQYVLNKSPVNFGVMKGSGSRDIHVDIRLLFFLIWAPVKGRMNKNQKRLRIDASYKNDTIIFQGIAQYILKKTPVNFGVMEGAR